MKKTVANSIILAGYLGLSACSPKPQFQTVFWTEKSGTKAPSISEKGTNTLTEADLSAEKIVFLQQSFAGAKIENSFIKKISQDGELVYLAAAVTNLSSLNLEKQITKMTAQAPTIVPMLQRKDSLFKDYQYNGTPEVVIQSEPWGSQAFWKVVYFDKTGQAWSVYVNEQEKIVFQQREGSSFHEAMALAFTESPKRTDIRSVTLKDLTGDGTLSSQRLTVVSESQQKAVASNGLFNFSPPDEKFDQVQTFYFLNRALTYFQETLGVKVPFGIKAIVHIGYPEKTNAAFYYNGQIRLGSGDDVVYSKIPLDPTIAIHEAGHALVETLARLPFQGEGGSLNEAFADFFTCTQLKSPLLADTAYRKKAYRRTVANTMKLSDRNGGLYNDSLIVSGTLWEIKEKLGEDKVIPFAVKLLSRQHPASDLASFRQSLKDLSAETFKGEELTQVQTILAERGW